MRANQRNRHSAAGAPRSRLIIGLLLLISILVVVLVVQAAQSLRANRSTATVVLQDYARLVADEYLRRAMGDVGYYGYYANINSLRQQLIAGDGAKDEPAGIELTGTGSRPASLARYRFLIDPTGAGNEWSLAVKPEVREYLSQRAEEILQGEQPESGLTIDHRIINGQLRTVVFATLTGPDRVFGFEVDRTALATRLEKVFEENTLLPGSLAGGRITNDHVYVRFTDEGGQVLFQSPGDYDPNLVVNKLVDDAYSGIFENYSIDAAIDPAVADALVIGGLPRSRLPVLIITVLLTFGLLIASIRQLQREQALMQMRTDFVSEVSHELRTPLTQIRMFTETLLFERFESSDDRRRALEIINRESQRLTHLVENVLQFSSRNGERRELNPARGELAPVIQRVVDEFRPLADSAGNTIELDLDKHVEAVFDADALRQILLNLLDNAVKYGPSGQTIRVSLAERADAARLCVCDEGPGVPEASRESIWDGYCRLDRERQSAIAGTGIGLSVVRDLVTQLGGSAWVDKNGEAGARFVVELPGLATQQ